MPSPGWEKLSVILVWNCCTRFRMGIPVWTGGTLGLEFRVCSSEVESNNDDMVTFRLFSDIELCMDNMDPCSCVRHL